MLKNDREEYEKIFKNFGTQLKFGCYNDFGMNKENLKDLILFYSSTTKNLTTLKEYVERMKDGQEKIFYAAGETIVKLICCHKFKELKKKGMKYYI